VKFLDSFVSSKKQKALCQVPEADDIDGDDAGCFCGHVYCEAVDAVDLNGEHLKDGIENKVMDEDEVEELNLLLNPPTNVTWNPCLEFVCVRQCRNRATEFKWRTLEIEGMSCCFGCLYLPFLFGLAQRRASHSALNMFTTCFQHEYGNSLSPEATPKKTLKNLGNSLK